MNTTTILPTITDLPAFVPATPSSSSTGNTSSSNRPPLRRSLRPGAVVRVTQSHIDEARWTRAHHRAWCKGRHSAISYAILDMLTGYALGVHAVITEARTICAWYRDPATAAPAGYAQIALPAEAIALVEYEDCGVWDKMLPCEFVLGACRDADEAVRADFARAAAGAEGDGAQR